MVDYQLSPVISLALMNQGMSCDTEPYEAWNVTNGYCKTGYDYSVTTACSSGALIARVDGSISIPSDDSDSNDSTKDSEESTSDSVESLGTFKKESSFAVGRSLPMDDISASTVIVPFLMAFALVLA